MQQHRQPLLLAFNCDKRQTNHFPSINKNVLSFDSIIFVMLNCMIACVCACKNGKFGLVWNKLSNGRKNSIDLKEIHSFAVSHPILNFLQSTWGKNYWIRIFCSNSKQQSQWVMYILCHLFNFVWFLCFGKRLSECILE